jgi:hypothetical protein
MLGTPLLDGSAVDRCLALRPGTAERLARRGRLPHVVLPNGSIRFEWDEVEQLLLRQPTRGASAELPGGAALVEKTTGCEETGATDAK